MWCVDDEPMQSLDALNLLPVWVNPDHLAVTAKIILAGHHLKVLGVVEGTELVGVVSAAQTLDQPDNTHVRDFMRPAEWVVDASTPLRQLAETFWQEDLDYLAVMRGDRFRGIVTPNMLLKEMARSWDPLTGLSWSDRLREWGVDNLKEGREITILFIDLDDFGSYNKKYGHIVGDRVLQKVAEMLQERVEPARDLLVRYGGDEFAIGTVRDQNESKDLARALQAQTAALRVAGSDEPVTFSVGVQGGKRTKERENVHYAATLDNLINLASKNAMAEKQGRKGIETKPSADLSADTGPATEPEDDEISRETAADLAEAHAERPAARVDTEGAVEPAATTAAVAPDHAIVEETVPGAPAESRAPRVVEVIADAADANSVTEVSIEIGGQAAMGVCPRKGGSVLKSVALATADAVLQIRPDIKLEIRELNMTESESGVRFISVIGTANIDGEDQPIGGVGTVGRNLYQTVAEATLQAYTNFEAVRQGAQ